MSVTQRTGDPAVLASCIVGILPTGAVQILVTWTLGADLVTPLPRLQRYYKC